MNTITIAEFKKIIEHEEWEHHQKVLWIEERERTDDSCDEYTVIRGGYGAVEVSSVFDGIKISYVEHFEYDDFEPHSFNLHAPGDHDWTIQGLGEVADEDGELQGILELIRYLPVEFSEIDYTFLKPKLHQLTDITNDDADETKIFIIPVSNGPNIRFSGEKIANVSSSTHKDSDCYSGDAGRWEELFLYKTNSGKFVCQQIRRSDWAGDHDWHNVRVCSTIDEVKKFLGFDWLAKRLYARAQADSTVLVD